MEVAVIKTMLEWTTKGDRGFARAEFEDLYGQKCSIQKSSLATSDAIWLGVDVDLNCKEVYGRMHLDREQARELIAVLTRFVGTGEIE